MPNRALSAFCEGFRKGRSSRHTVYLPSGPVAKFLYGLLAFLTAKTLFLGAEREPNAGASKTLLSPKSFSLALKLFNESQGSTIPVEVKVNPDSFVLTKSACKIGQRYLPISTDLARRVTYVKSYGGVPGAKSLELAPEPHTDSYRVLHNPYFCARQFWEITRSHHAVQIRRSGERLDRERLGIKLTFCLSVVFYLLSAIDVLAGVLCRFLQLPYYLLMYAWHSRKERFAVQLDDNRNVRACIYGPLDMIFTSAAVVITSSVAGLGALCLNTSLGGGRVGFLCVNIFCGVLAALTVVAIFKTVRHMVQANKDLRGSCQKLPEFIFEGDKDSSLVIVGCATTRDAPKSASNDQKPLKDWQDAAHCIAVSQYPGEMATDHVRLQAWQDAASFLAFSQYLDEMATDHVRLQAWQDAASFLAFSQYLDEMARGAYIPAHFRAGFGGMTAFSIVEEVVHSLLHVPASFAVCGVEAVYGQRYEAAMI